MKKLSALLTKKTLNQRSPLDEKSVFFVFNKVIKEEYGKQGSEHIVPRLLKDRKIFVETTSSVWSGELWLNRAFIVARINSEIGNEEITDISIK